MTLAEYLASAIDWIEAHEHTVDLVKWIAAGIAAWALGVFRAIRAWALRPSISIEPKYSHCFADQHKKLGEHNSVTLFSIVLDAAIMNPTGAKIGVRGFELQLRRSKWWPRWTEPVPAIGFPTMPRTPMPDNAIKVVPLWMTSFEGYDASLTHSDVDAQDSAAGLVFFAIALPDSSIPTAEHRSVKLTVTLGTGERRSVVANIKIQEDLGKLERMVPGSLPYVRHESVWSHRA